MNVFRSSLLAFLAAPALLLESALVAAAPQWQGLRVSRESIDSIEAVNGVPVRIERFAGKDVPELLRRWLAEWRADDQTAGQSGARSGEWRVYTRLLRPASQEVLQVRGEGESSELLWSRLALSTRRFNEPSPLSLPAGCKAGPRVQGRDDQGAFEMSTAVCRGSPLRPQARSCGLETLGNSLCVVPLPGADVDTASALVLLRRKAAAVGR